MPQKIALALSGGVDSSTAAYLLKHSGASVTGVYCRFYARDMDETRRIEAEALRAEQVAQQLKIDFQILDLAKSQKELVVDYFVKAYQNGDSPNPCIVCNRDLKFGLLLDWALAKGFDYLATGHYAQILSEKNHFYLASALDSSKDQSYFLYHLREEQLAKILFPLGKLHKSEVKMMAAAAGLKIPERESFDVCFLNNISLKAFLQQKINPEPGELVDSQGLVLGQHQGLAFYTIGQRQGFQINHQALKNSQVLTFDANAPPALYVIGKNKANNQLVVGEQNDCFSQDFYVQDLHFVNPDIAANFDSKKTLACFVKVRNTGQVLACQLKKIQDQFLVHSSQEIFALAGGQAAVFYQENQPGAKLLAGATIDRVVALTPKS